MSQFNLGSLIYSVGLDYSVAQQELNRFERILEDSSQRFSIMLTETLSNTVQNAVKDGLDGGMNALGESLGKGLVAGFAGVVSAGMTEAINVALSTAVQSRATLVKSVVGGIGTSIVEGMQLYGEEYRSMERAKFNFGAGSREEIPASFSKEAETQIVELASETARTRGEVTNLLYELSRSGISANQVVNPNDSLLRSTVQLSEAADLPDMKDAAFLISALSSVFTQTSSNEIASGLYGLTTTNLAEFEQYRFAFQDAAPAAAQAGIDFSEDFLPSMSILFKQMSPEVAGTAMKTLLQSIVSPTGGSGGLISAISQEIQGGQYEGLDANKGFTGNLSTSGNFLKTIRSLDDIVSNLLSAGELEDFQAEGGFDSLSEGRQNQEIQRIVRIALGGNDTAIQTYRSLTTPGDKEVAEIERRFANFTDPDRKESAIAAAQAIKYEGFAGALDQISSSLENVKVSMGKIVSPGVTQAVLTFRDVANDINAAIPSIGGPLERMSNMVQNTFQPGTSQYDNIVNGVQSTFSTVFQIFEGWTDQILGLFDSPEESEELFNRLNNLIVDTTNAFSTLAGVMKNLLPLVNEFTGGRLGKAEAGLVTNQIRRNQIDNPEQPNFLPDYQQFVGIKGAADLILAPLYNAVAGSVNAYRDFKNPDRVNYTGASARELAPTNQVFLDDASGLNPFSTDRAVSLSGQGRNLTTEEIDAILETNPAGLLADAYRGMEDGKAKTVGEEGSAGFIRADPEKLEKSLQEFARVVENEAGERVVTVDRVVDGQVRSYAYELDNQGQLTAQKDSGLIDRVSSAPINQQGTQAFQTAGAGALAGQGLSSNFLTASDAQTQKALEALSQQGLGQYLVTREDEKGDTQYRITQNQRKLEDLTQGAFATRPGGALDADLQKRISEITSTSMDTELGNAVQQAVYAVQANTPAGTSLTGKQAIKELRKEIENQGVDSSAAMKQLLPELGVREIQDRAAIANYRQLFTSSQGFDSQSLNALNTAIQGGDLTEALKGGFGANANILSNMAKPGDQSPMQKFIEQVSGEGTLTEAQIRQIGESLGEVDLEELNFKDQGEEVAFKVMQSIFTGLGEVELDDKSALKELIQRIIEGAREDAAQGGVAEPSVYQEQLTRGAENRQQQFVNEQAQVISDTLSDFRSGEVENIGDSLGSRFDSMLDDGDSLSQAAFDRVGKDLGEQYETALDRLKSTDDPEEKKEQIAVLNSLKEQSEALQEFASAREEITFNRPPQVGDPGITADRIDRNEIAEQQKIISQRRALFNVTQQLISAEQNLIAERESLFGQTNRLISGYFQEINSLDQQRSQLLMGISDNALALKRLDQEPTRNANEGLNTAQQDILKPFMEERRQLLTETIQSQREIRELLPELRDAKLQNFFQRNITSLFKSIRDASSLTGNFSSGAGGAFNQFISTFQRALPQLAQFQERIRSLRALQEEEPEAFAEIADNTAPLSQLEGQLDDLKNGVIANLENLAEKVNLQTLLDFQQKQSAVLSSLNNFLTGSSFQTESAIAQFQNTSDLESTQLLEQQRALEEEINRTRNERGGTELDTSDQLSEARENQVNNLEVQQASSLVNSVTEQVVNFYSFVRDNVQRISDRVNQLSAELRTETEQDLFEISRDFESRTKQIRQIGKSIPNQIQQLREFIQNANVGTFQGIDGETQNLVERADSALQQVLPDSDFSFSDLIGQTQQASNDALINILNALDDKTASILATAKERAENRQELELLKVVNDINEQMREPLRIRSDGLQELMGLEAERLSSLFQLNPEAQRQAENLRLEAERERVQFQAQEELRQIRDRRGELEKELETAGEADQPRLEQAIKAQDIREEVTQKRTEAQLELIAEEQTRVLDRFTEEFLRVGETIIDGLKSATDQLVDGLASGSDNLGENLRETLAEIPRTYLKGTLRNIVDNVFGDIFQPFDKRDVSLQEASLEEFSTELASTLQGQMDAELDNLNNAVGKLIQAIQGMNQEFSGELTESRFASFLGMQPGEMGNLFKELFPSDSGELFQKLAQIPNLDLGSSAMVAMQQETNTLLADIKQILNRNTGGDYTGGSVEGKVNFSPLREDFNPELETDPRSTLSHYSKKYGLNEESQESTRDKLEQRFKIEIPENPSESELFSLVKKALSNMGLSEDRIAAYLTYMNAESNGNPYAYNPDEDAYGIFQYQGVRDDNLPEATGDRALDLLNQVDFSLDEENLLERLKNAESGIDAMAKIIRPSAENVEKRKKSYNNLMSSVTYGEGKDGLVGLTGGGAGDRWSGSSTGPHVDIKAAALSDVQSNYPGTNSSNITSHKIDQTAGRRGNAGFTLQELDQFIEIGGKPISHWGTSSGYGKRNLGDGFHAGIDLAIPSGKEIVVKNGAKVIRSIKGNNQGYGGAVIIQLPDGRVVALNHLKEIYSGKPETKSLNVATTRNSSTSSSNNQKPSLNFGMGSQEAGKVASAGSMTGLFKEALYKPPQKDSKITGKVRLPYFSEKPPEKDDMFDYKPTEGANSIIDSFLEGANGFDPRLIMSEQPTSQQQPERLTGVMGFLRKLFGLEADYAGMNQKEGFQAMISGLMNLSGVLPSLLGLSSGGFLNSNSYGFASGVNVGGGYNSSGSTTLGWRDYAQLGTTLFSLGSTLFGSSPDEEGFKLDEDKYGDDPYNEDGGNPDYIWRYDPRNMTGLRAHIKRDKKEEDKGGGFLSTLLGIGSMVGGLFGGFSEGGTLAAVYPGEKWYSTKALNEMAAKNGFDSSQGVAIAEYLRQQSGAKTPGTQSISEILAKNPDVEVQDFANKSMGTIAGNTPKGMDLELANLPDGFVANTDLLSSPQWKKFESGNYRAMNTGGMVEPKGFNLSQPLSTRSVGGESVTSMKTKSPSEEEDMREVQPVEVKVGYETKEIAGERYVTEDQFRRGIEDASNRAVAQVQENLRYSNSFRKRTGI